MRSGGTRLYNIFFIPILRIVVIAGSLFSRKIRQGLNGRKHYFERLDESIKQLSEGQPCFWIHCSSMGEFEQAKPVIQGLRSKFSKGRIIATFFSPSVLDHVNEFPGADYLGYIPFDSKKNATRFLDIINPDVALFVRHDVWPNHLAELRRRKIPSILINCSIRSAEDYRFPLTLRVNRFLYRFFDLILTVSSETKRACEEFGYTHSRTEVVGDTRYDQVIRRAKEAETIVKPLRKLKGNRIGFVMGSTWPSDEEVLFQGISRIQSQGLNPWCVLVPHEPSEERVQQICQRAKEVGLHPCRFSDIESGNTDIQCDMLIVDRVGILASLYALGDLCFVGGGFGPGIHNVLEPAAFGKIVLFGPRCRNSYEAGLLEKRGVGIVIKNGDHLTNILTTVFSDPEKREGLGKISLELVQENSGATNRIITFVSSMIAKS